MRRFIVSLIAAVTALALAAPGTAVAQPAVDPSELLQPGPLPEHALGDPDAPVTIVEYVSLTCHHCEAFHNNVWPELKEKFVDTGKVRFILREFPFDTPGAAGAMLARCAKENWYAVVDLLFRNADSWTHSNRPLNALADLMAQVGMDRQAFEQCLSDQTLLQQIEAGQKHAHEKFGVRATPTFFINGRRHVGALSLALLAYMIEAAEPTR
jgi:protein-disulfide isomerase